MAGAPVELSNCYAILPPPQVKQQQHFPNNLIHVWRTLEEKCSTVLHTVQYVQGASTSTTNYSGVPEMPHYKCASDETGQHVLYRRHSNYIKTPQDWTCYQNVQRTHTYTHARARARTHTHTHTHRLTQTTHTHARTHARARAHTHTHTHSHTHGRTHARTHTRTHTHTHTHRPHTRAHTHSMLASAAMTAEQIHIIITITNLLLLQT